MSLLVGRQALGANDEVDVFSLGDKPRSFPDNVVLDVSNMLDEWISRVFG